MALPIQMTPLGMERPEMRGGEVTNEMEIDPITGKKKRKKDLVENPLDIAKSMSDEVLNLLGPSSNYRI